MINTAKGIIQDYAEDYFIKRGADPSKGLSVVRFQDIVDGCEKAIRTQFNTEVEVFLQGRKLILVFDKDFTVFVIPESTDLDE